jgi:hypothetical protein
MHQSLARGDNVVVRTTLVIDDDVYEIAVEKARHTGESLGKIVSEMARRGVASRAKVQMVRKGRFFQVAVPADAPKIDSRSVQKTWEEEGIG